MYNNKMVRSTLPPPLPLSSSCSADKLRKFRQKVSGETKNKIIEKLTQFFGAAMNKICA